MNRIHPVAWRVLLFLLKNQLLKLTCIEAIISTQIIQPALHVIPLAERMKTVNLNLESSSLNEKNYMKSLEDFLSHTLREVFSGPLAKKHIHLYVDAEVEGLVDIDRLLVHINKPLSLARHFVNGTSLNYLASEEVGEIYDFDALNPYSENESIPDESILQSRGYNHQYNTGTVFVYVKHGKLETISSPPLATSYAGLLLVSLQEDCNINTIRQVPLSSETASVALMCLTRKGDLEVNPKLTLSFQVFTWLPFHPKDRLHSLGTWSSDTFPEWEQLFIDRFESFEGSTLHVSSDDSDMPFFFNIDNVTFDGTSKRIMDELGEWINFSFTFTKSASDDKWGETVNGTWVGMLGDVLRGDKDLAVNYFSVTEERAQHFAFSVSHYNEGFGFTIRVPPPLPRWLSLTYPFTLTVWGGVLIALFLTATTYFLLQGESKTSVFESFLVTAKSLINQSGNRVPLVWSQRAFLGIWWISAYIIVLSYTCNLIAVLTIPVYPTRIRSIGQLAESNYRVCMLDYGEFVPEALATSMDAQLYTLGSKLDLVPTTVNQDYYGEEGCVTMVLQGTHAHVETFSYNQLIYIEMGYSGVVYFVKEQIYKANLAFFFRKHTPWKFKFDRGIRLLVESGLVQKWYDDIMDEIRRKGKMELTQVIEQALSLAHLQGPFLIYALGLSISSGVFIYEHLRK